MRRFDLFPIIGPMLLKQKDSTTTVMKLLLSRLTTKSKPIVIKLYIVKYCRGSDAVYPYPIPYHWHARLERDSRTRSKEPDFFAIRHKVKHRMTLSPSGRSSRTTDDHQHQEDELRREAIFRRSITKTGGGDDIGNLEERNFKTLSDIGTEMKDIVSDQDTGHGTMVI